MSTQAYLVIALILAVLLDLGLLLWTRRNLEKRGITTDDKRAVHLFNRYSPIFTWLNYTTLSILEIRNKSLKLPKLFVKKTGTGLRDNQPENKFPNNNLPPEPAKLAHKSTRLHLRFQISTNERIQITVESSTYDHLDDGLIAEDTSYPDTSTRAPVGTNVSGRLNSNSTFSDVNDRVIHNKNKGLSRVFNFFTEHWLVTDFMVIILAAVPVILIVMDRWLEKPIFIQGLNEHWNQIASPLGLVYPAYFLIIISSLIVAFILILVRKVEPIDVEDRDLQQSKQNLSIVSTPRNMRRTKFLLYGSGICLLIALLAGVRLNVVSGWWFLLAIFMYIIAWLLRSLSIQGIFDYLTKNGAIILSYTTFCLALLYFLAAVHLNWNYRWLYLLATILLFVNALRYFRRIHPILWFVPIFMILFTYRINGWEFSVIGDEYSFYDYAKSLATERSFGYIGSHIFDGQAVFGSHPFFSSLLQAIPMKLFGVNNFSWRISNILFISASIPLFFYFFRAFTSQFVAMATSLFIGVSHYLMTFGKIGYNNLQALFALALVLSVSAWTVKTRSRNRYLLLGLSLGLCFYVYPVAIYVLGTWLIFMLFFNPPNNKVALKNWLVMAGMFFIIISPLFVQSDYWRTKVAGTIFYSPHLIENVNTFAKHILNNLLYSFFSFLYLAEEAHFVTVSYVDPLTALLTILGILSSLSWVRKNRFIAFICISFWVMLLFVGVSHDRYYPPTTRMFMLLPWFVFFAAIGLRWMYNLLMRITDRPINPSIFLSVAFVAVVMLNLYQAYSLSLHRMTRYQSPEMLFLRLVQKMSTTRGADSPTTRFIFLTDGKWGIDGYRKMQEVYTIPDSFLELDSYNVAEDVWPSPIVNTIQNQNTLVIVYANMDQDLLNKTTINLSALQKISCPVAALDGSIRFYLWYSSQMQWVCENI